MKGIIHTIAAGFLVFTASTTMAATQTSLASHWTCTTNASSSDVAADKAADEKMGKNAVSAKEAFEFAASNCRDCNKITCEAESK